MFPERADIEAARDRISGHVRRTPVLNLPGGALGFQGFVSFKLEFLQVAGSFKSRGAFNSLTSQPVPEAGVTAASGGNHGAAVAFAARELGVPARIFVPQIASAAKIALIRACGAEIVIGGERYADAQAACDRHAAESGALLIHPFSAPATMAGQGTVAPEWDEQTHALDTVLVAVGGGGLVAGMASWWAGTGTKVIGVEPQGSRALHAAFEARRPVDVEVQSIAADSLGARNVGDLVWSICRERVHEVVLVPDEAIREAQRRLWGDFRMALEPGGAAAAGALLSGAYRPDSGERVGLLLCGANLDARALQEISA
jgi:threonine dehydratase